MTKKRPKQARVIASAPWRNDGDAFHPPTCAGIDASSLIKVRRGAFVRSAEWNELYCEGRLRTRAHAVSRRAECPTATCSHTTAAAMHQLAVYRGRSDRIDIIVPGRHSRQNSKDVVRHHHQLKDDDVVLIDGLRVTSLDRTVYDVIRTSTLEAAVVCFDAALRQVAWNDADNTYDAEAAERFRKKVTDRIRANAGARGIRQARFVAEFADGRAQLPGESISRLWMWQLGLPAPQLQYRVDFPDGTYALLDFAWPELGRWAEFDGEIKYTDPEILAGREPDEILAAQHQRERSVRRVTGWRVDRWGFDEMATLDEFAQHLRSIGLYAP